MKSFKEIIIDDVITESSDVYNKIKKAATFKVNKKFDNDNTLIYEIDFMTNKDNINRSVAEAIKIKAGLSEKDGWVIGTNGKNYFIYQEK